MVNAINYNQLIINLVIKYEIMTELKKISKALKQIEEENFKLREELTRTKINVKNSSTYKELKNHHNQVCKKLNELEKKYRKLNENSF